MAEFHVVAGANGLVRPRVRRISIGDVFDCLSLGLADFRDRPTHYIFLIILYPLIGVILMTWTSGANALPLIFPLVSGFALIGPFAGIGLYEISRRREQGLDPSWLDALAVRHSPALPSIAAVGLFLLIVFVAWMLTAQQLYVALMGPGVPASFGDFMAQVVGTEAGWTLIVVGNLVGLAFAVVVLTTTVIAFPLLLDRDVGAYAAIETSARAVMANPVPMALWGVIVAVGLAIGMLPLFAGLAVVLPILGHATWHLYRRLIATD